MHWLKREKEILVPITMTDTRTHREKWQDEEYLKAVKTMTTNSVFISETFEALKGMRTIADEAKTTDELAGIQKCIRIMKALLTAPERAKRQIEGERLLDDLNKPE